MVQQFLGLLLNLINWLIVLSVQTFQLLIVIYKRGNFVYYHGQLLQFIRWLKFWLAGSIVLCIIIEDLH